MAAGSCVPLPPLARFTMVPELPVPVGRVRAQVEEADTALAGAALNQKMEA